MEMDIPTQQQPDLIPFGQDEGRELLVFAEPGRVPRHTGERVARDRERYEGIVAALGEGMSRRQVMRTFKVGQHTIEMIEEREARLVATLRDRMANRFRRASVHALERFEEELAAGNVPPATQWVAAATFLDKSILLSGGATSRHEVVSQGPQEALADRFAAMKAARVVEIGAGEAAPDSESGVEGGESR